MKETNLETIADGVAAELFKHELGKVTQNIMDANTGALTKRKIVLEFVFAPDESREEVKITVSSKSTIAQVKSYTKTAHMGKKNGKATLYQADTKQIDMFDENVSGLEAKRAGANA